MLDLVKYETRLIFDSLNSACGEWQFLAEVLIVQITLMIHCYIYILDRMGNENAFIAVSYQSIWCRYLEDNAAYLQ